MPLFLLGAGFDRAISSSSPLNSELLPKLFELHGTANREFQECFQKYNTNDIETFLTLLDMDSFHEGLRKRINDWIAEYFLKFTLTAQIAQNCSWAGTFSTELLRPKDAIVSLNYSCLLDGLLDYEGIWSPSGGYSQWIQNTTLLIVDEPGFPANAALKDITLYKIHGSAHFREIGSSPIDDNKKTGISFEINPAIFPRSAEHSHLGAGLPNLGPYVIAPSFVKMPHAQIIAMMTEVLDRSKREKTLVIIGCQLRKEDNFLWLLLWNFLTKGSTGKKLVILDPLAQPLVGKICQFFSPLASADLANMLIPIPEKLEVGFDKLMQIVNHHVEVQA